MSRTLYKNSESVTPELSERMKALAAAVNAKGEYVLGYLTTLTRDFHLAKDLAQQTWLKVYQSFQTEQFTHMGLLKRKARQVFIDHLRAAKTRSFVEIHEDVDNIKTTYVSREQAGSDADAILKARFWENFAPLKLDPIDKECFWLLNRFGYTINEVSAHVNLPVSTIHDRLKRLKQACVERLEEECR